MKGMKIDGSALGMHSIYTILVEVRRKRRRMMKVGLNRRDGLHE